MTDRHFGVHAICVLGLSLRRATANQDQEAGVDNTTDLLHLVGRYLLDIQLYQQYSVSTSKLWPHVSF